MATALNPDAYEELEALADIFDCMYFDEKRVDCFEVIKDMAAQKCSIKDFGPERRKDLLWQFQEAMIWLEELHVHVTYKEAFLSYLKTEPT